MTIAAQAVNTISEPVLIAIVAAAAAIVAAAAALVGALVGSIPGILSSRAEDRRWQQEQQGAKIEKITNAAAQVITTASPVHILTSSVVTISSGDPKISAFWAAFANWELVIYSYVSDEQKVTLVNDRAAISEGHPDAFMISHRVLLITHDIVSKIQGNPSTAPRPPELQPD